MNKRRAFTLIELLVVISIFVLLLALAVPAFSSMLYSSEQSQAENTLRSAMAAARDVAARSPAGQDSAAVFVYDHETKKMSVLICTSAGVLEDAPSPASNPPPGTTIPREVFAPAPGVEPIQFQQGWMVRGFAPPAWFATSLDNDSWYERTYPTADRQDGHWVFPETSFFHDDTRNDGDNRQTFMVRFEGGTGILKASDPTSVLVLQPSTEVVARMSWYNPPSGFGVNNNPLNADNEPDPLRFVRRILSWPQVPTANGPITLLTKQRILGNEASDTMLAKPVAQLALCSENRLARGIGARIDNDTGCLYILDEEPILVPATDPGSSYGQYGTYAIDEWVRGYDNAQNRIDSDCRIFTVHRYLGWLQEVTGTVNGEGVSQ